MAFSTSGSSKTQYDFHTLKTLTEAKSTMRGINVIAVVKFFRQPHKSRGTSYTMTIGLTDPSLKGGKFICTVFNDLLSHLPQIKANGDIVIFHRLLVEQFFDKKEIRGSGLPGMGFASAVFDGQSVDGPLEQRSGWSSINITESDLQRVRELRQWYLSKECPVEKEVSTTTLPSIPSAGGPSSVVLYVVSKSSSGADRRNEITCTSLKRLEEIDTPNTFFDVAGHVLGVYRLKDDRSCAVIRIWDGTAIRVPVSPFGLQLEEQFINLATLNIPHALWLSRHRYLDVFIFDEHASEESLSGIEAGNMILITNVHLVLSRNTPFRRRYCELRLHGGGLKFRRGVHRIVYSLSDEYVTSLHQRLIQLYKLFQPTKVAAKYEQASILTLSHILSLEPVTWKYKVTAHVGGIEPAPNRVLECLHWICKNCGVLKQFNLEQENLDPDRDFTEMKQRSCSNCDNVMSLEMIFQILFEESCGSLLVNIWNKHALYLFRQYLKEPLDLVTSVECRQNVALCLKYLPKNEITFILVSYLPQGAASDERQYQIVDTEIVA